MRVELPNATTVNYKYDGLGRRVEKEVIGGTTNVTRYVYDNEDILLELDGNNNIVARYTHGPGIDEPLVMEKGGQNYYYHADGLGSITEITNQSGGAIQRYTYSSFGEIESQQDSNFVQPYAFTSREFDSETGLYFYRARSYDSLSGRFLQEDPLGLSVNSLSLYTYALNNPVLFGDPNGEDAIVLPTIIACLSTPACQYGLVVVTSYVACRSMGCDICPLDLTNFFARKTPDKESDKDETEDPRGGHRSKIRLSTEDKHERGDERRRRDQGGEKKDKRMPYRQR